MSDDDEEGFGHTISQTRRVVTTEDIIVTETKKQKQKVINPVTLGKAQGGIDRKMLSDQSMAPLQQPIQTSHPLTPPVSSSSSTTPTVSSSKSSTPPVSSITV